MKYIGRNVCYESTRRLFYCDICPPAATFSPSGDNCEISGIFLFLDFYLYIFIYTFFLFFTPKVFFDNLYLFFKLSYKSTLIFFSFFYILSISCTHFNDVENKLIRHVFVCVCVNENFEYVK